MSAKRAARESWPSSSSSDGDDDDGDFSDDDQDEPPLHFYPLCTVDTSDPSLAYPTLAEALRHDLDECGFGALSHCLPPSDDDFFERAIALVNRSRSFVLTLRGDDDDKASVGAKLDAHLKEAAAKDRERGDVDETLFRPVLTDDAVLMSLDELGALRENYSKDGGSECEEGPGDDDDDVADVAELGGRLNGAAPDAPEEAALRAKISALEEQLARAKACIAALTAEDSKPASGKMNADDEKTTDGDEKPPDNDTYYFASYSHHSIHETMLKDSVRTEAYRDAIMGNSNSLFRDKVVLDVGCGTGVLSIFAARAGARKVVAIDGSGIIDDARNIVDANGLGGIVTCVRGKVEELLETEALPLEEIGKVDVIVSEWMGYALLFETMLPSVLKVRDALLSPTGTMFPNVASIHLEGASDDRLAYWDDVYGIDMSHVKRRIGTELASEASVEVVDAGSVTTDRVELIRFDLNECRDGDLDFDVPFELSPETAGEHVSAEDGGCRIDKLVVSFDVRFDVPGSERAVSFSTGCQSEPTHWKQASVWFDPIVGVPTLGHDEVMRGRFKMGRNRTNHREMDCHVLWEIGRKAGSSGDDEDDGKEEEFVRRSQGSTRCKLSA